MKLFSGILFSFLMLAPGLHLTIDYHICHDRIAGTAISLTGQHAPGCAGEEFPQCSDEEQIMNHCCSGFTATYSTADDFVTTSIQNNPVVYPQIVYDYPVNDIYNNFSLKFNNIGLVPIDDTGGLTEPLIDLFCVYRI